MIFVVLLFFISTIAAETIETPHGYTAELALEIEQKIPTRYHARNCTIVPVGGIDCDELAYLIGIPEGSSVTAQTLKSAFFYLGKKNKFSLIRCTYTIDGELIDLTWDFTTFTTVERVIIKGFFFGKEKYKSYYLIDPGERFDREKHEHSKTRILQALADDGFGQAQIDDSCLYDEYSGSMTIYLSITRGTQSRVHSVTCQANNNESLQEIIEEKIKSQLCKRLLGASYTKDLINAAAADIKSWLIKEGFVESTLFLKQEYDKNTNCVSLDFLVELGQQHEFVFLGNTAVSNDELLDCVMTFGSAVAELPPVIVAQEIRQFYKERGYLQAHIETEQDAHKQVFTIHEGPRAKIDQIIITGINDEDQNRIFATCFNPLLAHHFFDQASYKKACAKMLDDCVSRGYWSASIKNYELKKRDDEHYDIYIELSLGNQRIITQINLGNCVLPAKLACDIGEVFTPGTIGAQRDMLAYSFGSNNEYEPHIVHENNQVSITWKVIPKKTTELFGKTVVMGATKLPFDYLTLPLRFTENDPWNPELIKVSTLALKELVIFDTVNLSPSESDDPEGKRPVVLKIVPDDPFEVRARTGIGFEYAGKELRYDGITYKCGGAMVFKNPFNRGDYFFANADFTRTHRILEGGYYRPWIMKIPMGTTGKLYNNAFKYPGTLADQKSLYTITQQGGLLGLDKRWDFFQLTTNVGLEWMETVISNDRPQQGEFNRLIARAMNFEPALLDKKIPYAMIEPTFYVNFLDNQMYPCRGFSTMLTLKGMVPIQQKFANALFLKLLFEQSVFIQLWSLVFGFRVRAGHIFYQLFSSIMPSERFYLGGAFSLRSYATDMAPPLGIVDQCDDERAYVPQGGKSMMNCNLECRFPLFGGLNGAIFQDLGVLSGTGFLALLQSEVLAGTGFGLRYNTPLGPFRFDIGFKWHKPAPDISRYAWFLTFGQAF